MGKARVAIVTFAVPGGGEHHERVTVGSWRSTTLTDGAIASTIRTATRACKDKGIAVANVLRIMRGKAMVFDYVTDTATRLR